MTKYNLHSVRIEDDVWAQAKASGTSVNQLLRKALDMAWARTRGVRFTVEDLVKVSDTHDGNTVPRTAVSPRSDRKPLLKPSQK